MRLTIFLIAAITLFLALEYVAPAVERDATLRATNHMQTHEGTGRRSDPETGGRP